MIMAFFLRFECSSIRCCSGYRPGSIRPMSDRSGNVRMRAKPKKPINPCVYPGKLEAIAPSSTIFNNC